MSCKSTQNIAKIPQNNNKNGQNSQEFLHFKQVLSVVWLESRFFVGLEFRFRYFKIYSFLDFIKIIKIRFDFA